MRNLAIKDTEETFDVQFYFEEEYNCVIAFFPSASAHKISSCYVRGEGHSDCNRIYVENLRKATPAEYEQTLNDLINIYDYNLRIIE
jgi:hypothetical protein